MQEHEFDSYIKNYRKNQDKHVALSGESGTFFAEYKVQKMAEWFPELVNGSYKVLDYGCGDGLMTFFAEKQFQKSKFYGIDPSSESIKEAQANFKSIEFSVLYNNIMPYANDSMDFVFAAGVFHHIPFDEHQQCISEIFRVLKPSGTFILFELNPFNPLTVLTFKRSPVDKNATMVFPHYGKKLVKKYGATATKYYCFFPAFVRKLRVLEPFMTKIPFGALYATIARKNPY
jgi:ubiquinone/menaquinone biosynthesis C-methylase UbiE